MIEIISLVTMVAVIVIGVRVNRIAKLGAILARGYALDAQKMKGF